MSSKRLITSKLKINLVSINNELITFELFKNYQLIKKFNLMQSELVPYLKSSKINYLDQLLVLDQLNIKNDYYNYLLLIKQYDECIKTYYIWLNKYKNYPIITKKELNENSSDAAKRYHTVKKLLTTYKNKIKRFKKEILKNQKNIL